MKKWKACAVIVILILLLAGGVFRFTHRPVDAAGYVEAELNLLLQGDAQLAKQYVNASGSELKQVYENGIRTFLSEYLVGDMDTAGLFTNTYGKLVKEIFMVQRYDVLEQEKISKTLYKVKVRYQPSDVFEKFIPQLQEEADAIEREAADGEYEGTQEDIEATMLKEYLARAYTLLESDYMELQYKDSAEYTFTVRKVGKNLKMDEEEINVFLQKILALDNVD